jgi:hypothetical protein
MIRTEEDPSHYGLENLIEECNRFIGEQIVKRGVVVSAEEVGLDSRCGKITILADDDCIATKGSNALDYYGGFEYVKGYDRQQIGTWVLYSGSNERVSSVLDRYHESLDKSETP